VDINKSIDQLYSVDKLKIIFRRKEQTIEPTNYDAAPRKIINDWRFPEVYQNDYYYIAFNDKYCLVKFKNRTPLTEDFVKILKDIINDFKLGDDEDVYLDIALDTNTDIYNLFEQTRLSSNYVYEKKIKVKGSDQELYDSIDIGSRKDFFFRLYDKTKEILHSKKYYIQELHDQHFSGDTVYRLELSLRPKHCKQIKLDIFRLGEPEYLKQVYKTFFEDRFMFRKVDENDKNRSRWKRVYLFDIAGETCIRKNKVKQPDTITTDLKTEHKARTHPSYLKSTIRGFYNFYLMHGKDTYADCIVEACIDCSGEQDVICYVQKTIKEAELLNRINKAVEESNVEVDIFNI
jgi:hypothetical protein